MPAVNTDVTIAQNNDELVSIVEAISESTTSASTDEITQVIDTTLTTTVECKRDGYLLVPYSTIYTFCIVSACILLLIITTAAAILVIHKRKRFRMRHGEYKLTTVGNVPTKIKIERACDVKSEEMY